MKKRFKDLKIPIIFLFFLTTIIACDKDFIVLESDVLGSDKANFSTNSSIIEVTAYNKKLDSLQINGLHSNLLGIFNDPSYGKTIANIITQVTPSSYNPSFGTNPVIDSVVVNIPYFSKAIEKDDDGNSVYKLDSLYGNTSQEMKLTMYQNNYFLRDLDPNSTLGSIQNFYSNASNLSSSVLTGGNTVNFDNHNIATILSDTQFLPNNNPIITKTGTGDDEKVNRAAPAYRVALTSSEDLLYWTNTIIDKEDDAVLSNANNFKNYFRGIYFKVEPINNDGTMVLLNLASTSANITIHYTKGETDSRTQSTYVLNFSGNRINTFINDFNLVPLQNGNKVLGDDKLYLKGTSGSMAVVDIFGNQENLETFLNTYRIPDGNGGYEKSSDGEYILRRLINEAHLVLYEDENIYNVVDDNNDTYHKYDRLFAYDIKNNITTVDYQLDQIVNTQYPLNSKLISLTQRDTITGKYKIRLTQHLNNILLRDSTNTKIGLVLSNNVNRTENAQILNSNDEVTAVPAAAIISPRGTILYGSNAQVPEEKKLKLKIFYTEPN